MLAWLVGETVNRHHDGVTACMVVAVLGLATAGFCAVGLLMLSRIARWLEPEGTPKIEVEIDDPNGMGL